MEKVTGPQPDPSEPATDRDAGRVEPVAPAGETTVQHIVPSAGSADEGRPDGALQASERRFRALTEYATDLVAIVDTSGIVLYTSPSVQRLLGYPPASVQGTNMRGYAHKEDIARLLAAVEESTRCEGPVSPFLVRVRHAGGGWRTLELVINNRQNDDAVRGVIINARDVSEREELANALRMRVEEAEGMAEIADRLAAVEREQARGMKELAQMRNEFVTTVSHELRTPLTAIIGYAELLQARWGQTDEAQRLATVDKIVISAHRQYRLVADLLMLSQIEDSILESRREPVAVAPLATQVADEARATYRGQEIVLVGPADLRVIADADRTIQIIANLVDNAAKYSPEGTPVIITWCGEGDTVVLRVQDQGQGVAQEGQHRLFTRFGRVPGSSARRGRGGTGIGLYLAHRLAQAMGGALDLEVTSAEGSTFRLRLPAAPSP